VDVRNHKLADLPPVSRTLLIPLAYRALESRRPDALVCDPRAVALMRAFDEDIAKRFRRSGPERVLALMRARQFDHFARMFLAAHPRGIIVDIGCGLDTRFDRIDNGQMDWYGLDLPAVIELRRTLLPEGPRNHLIACSALDFAWMDCLPPCERPILFLAEGVFPYFEEADVRRLVLALRERFYGAELAFDGLTTFSIRMHNATNPGLRKAQTRARWGFDHAQDLEAWGAGIRLLEE
jgi:O-methyltransferase involved in polyketide biosynthesis